MRYNRILQRYLWLCGMRSICKRQLAAPAFYCGRLVDMSIPPATSGVGSLATHYGCNILMDMHRFQSAIPNFSFYIHLYCKLSKYGTHAPSGTMLRAS